MNLAACRTISQFTVALLSGLFAFGILVLQSAPTRCWDLYVYVDLVMWALLLVLAFHIMYLVYFSRWIDPDALVATYATVHTVFYAWSFIWFVWGISLLVGSECTGTGYHAFTIVSVVVNGLVMVVTPLVIGSESFA